MLNIIHEDAELLVINKPAGLVDANALRPEHVASGNLSGCKLRKHRHSQNLPNYQPNSE